MKKSFSKKMVALLLTLAVCITSVVGNQASVSAKSKIKISNTKITLTVGKSKTLKVKGTKKKAKWSSSKKSVASVTSKGKVTAKKAGSATITAKIGKKKYKCKVTVKSVKKPNNTNNVKPSTSISTKPTTSNNSPIQNKPTKPEQSQTEIIKGNYSKLKNIIRTYGNTNNKGNKYITYYDTRNNIQYGIVDENNGMFQFIMIDNMDSEIKSSCSMYVNITVSDNVNPELIVLFQKNGVTTGACTLETSFIASKYSKETILYFNIKENATGLTEADFQKYANANLKAAFSGWQLLLMGKADMQLADLGFISYK